ncbi:MAG: patatin-like phospholipase family protein [Armatimonadota bacterium]
MKRRRTLHVPSHDCYTCHPAPFASAVSCRIVSSTKRKSLYLNLRHGIQYVCRSIGEPLDIFPPRGAAGACGYRFENVAGTSAGAIIGALVAADYSASELKELIEGLDSLKFLDKDATDQE